MQFTFLCGYPYEFRTEISANGGAKYFIMDRSKDEEPEVEVGPDTWDRLVRASQSESVAFIAGALDGSHLAAMGKIPSVAERLNDIAAHVLGETSEEEEVQEKKAEELS